MASSRRLPPADSPSAGLADVPEDCPNPWGDPDDARFLAKFGFWFGVAYCCVGFVGLAGNAVSVAIFTLKDMRSTFHAFLVALALFDLVYCLLCGVTNALEMDPDNLSHPLDPNPLRPVFVYLYPYFLYPLSQIFSTASIYMTVTLSVNRYLVVVHPFSNMSHFNTPTPFASDVNRGDNGDVGGDGRSGSASSPSSYSSSSAVDHRRVVGSALAVLAFSTAYSVPHFFEYSVAENNETGELRVEWTDLRANRVYTELYTIAADLVVRIVVPVCVIIFTGVKVALVVRRHCRKGCNSFLATFASVLCLFVVCQSTKIANNIYNLVKLEQQAECEEATGVSGSGLPVSGHVLEWVAKMTILINSSVNFFIYLLTSAGFARHFKACDFCCCCRRRRHRRRGHGSLGRLPKSTVVTGDEKRRRVSSVAEIWYVIFEHENSEAACHIGR